MDEAERPQWAERPEQALSDVVRILPERLPGERPTLGDLIGVMGERATALTLLVFFIPAIVPKPGIPAGMIFGTALALLALQMMAGAEGFRLPRRLAGTGIPRRLIVGLANRSAPKLERLERHLRPRWPSLTGKAAMRPLGLIVFLMAALIALPIPFGNMLPGLSVFLVAVGLSQKDGGAVAGGLVFAVLASIFSGGILIGGWWMVDGRGLFRIAQNLDRRQNCASRRMPYLLLVIATLIKGSFLHLVPESCRQKITPKPS